MEIRKLGWTELKFTTIGLGTWAMGGGGWKFSWGPQEDWESVAAIHRGLDSGINWIDTAAVYGLGHSEEVVARALAETDHQPWVATKCGRVWDRMGNITGNISRESVKKEAENSLRRLRRETIDLYQIHWPLPEECIEEAWAAMGELVQEGKVRYAGVSNFNLEQLKRIHPIHPVASLQPPYSMLERSIEGDLLRYCARNQIGLVVYSPMAKGLLTGKMTRERVAGFALDDHRRNDPRFGDPQLSIHLELVEDLRRLAEKQQRTISQLVIAWVLRCPEITSAIVGTRSAAQIEETVGAGDRPLSAEESEAIDKLLADHREKIRAAK